MTTLTEHIDKNSTLNNVHLDISDIVDSTKSNLVSKLGLLESEMQNEVKDWNKIAFLNIEIAGLKYYLKLNK
jgi:hypothetical protein